MFLTKNLQQYICFSEHNLVDALQKISDNKSRIIFIVTEHGHLLGSISDGDFRRWLTETKTLNLNVPAKDVMNTNVQKLLVGTDKNEIKQLFTNGIDCVPLVDKSGHLVQLAFQKSEGFLLVK